MNDALKGRVGIVTGGASGIGRASALALAHRGAHLVVSDVDAAGGEETVGHIQAGGGTATFVQADVAQEQDVAHLIATTLATYDRLDIALNNAGIGGTRAPTATYPVDVWHQVLSVNLTGVWYCMKHQLPPMLNQGHGVIINVASVAGVRGFRGHVAYAASKHGVVGLTKTAALEYARHGLRINAVCPGFTDTPMVRDMMELDPKLEERLVAGIPQKRLGTPAEIGAAVAYLCSDEAAFITGHCLMLDGGLTAG